MTEEDIKKAISFNNKKVLFRDLVKTSSGFNIMECNSIPEIIIESADLTSKLMTGVYIPEGSDAKGKKAEDNYKLALEQLGFHPGKRTSGYPDFSITVNDTNYYIEVKTTTEKNLNSTNRYFYYCSSKKIKMDSHHLLLGFIPTKKGIEYKVVDLFKLECNFRSEFNASNKDIYL